MRNRKKSGPVHTEPDSYYDKNWFRKGFRPFVPYGDQSFAEESGEACV